MFLGSRIKEIRLLKNLKSYELAEISGISSVYLSDIERNLKTPKFKTLEKICSALDITLADFFAPASKDADVLPLELNQLLTSARKLSPEQLKLAQQLLDEMGTKQNS